MKGAQMKAAYWLYEAKDGAVVLTAFQDGYTARCAAGLRMAYGSSFKVGWTPRKVSEKRVREEMERKGLTITEVREG